jgi:hypothetical protein
MDPVQAACAWQTKALYRITRLVFIESFHLAGFRRLLLTHTIGWQDLFFSGNQDFKYVVLTARVLF